jgi:8-oxo-dGTP diphosphatase
VVIKDERILLVRRNSNPVLILPGGKPENRETDLGALAREIQEELGCWIDPERMLFLGEYEDELADDPSRRVVIRLYAGELHGRPRPLAEIAEIVWHPIGDIKAVDLAPSLRHQILRDLSNDGS